MSWLGPLVAITFVSSKSDPLSERSTSLDEEWRQRRVRLLLFWILWANLALVVIKIAVGNFIGSLAVLGDAAHSGVDAIANIVALAAIFFAAAPPDAEHPYGHSKFESLGALGIAGLLSVLCFELVRAGVDRILTESQLPRPGQASILILVGTMVVNILVASYESWWGRKLGSELLSADARHTWADVLVTLSVLGGLGLAAIGFHRADAFLAILVAGIVAYSGFRILRRTVPVLVDRRVVDPAQVYEVASGIQGVDSVTAVRSRGRPGVGFAELMIRVHPATQVRRAHVIADEVERAVAGRLGLLSVVVHIEPSELH